MVGGSLKNRGVASPTRAVREFAAGIRRGTPFLAPPGSQGRSSAPIAPELLRSRERAVRARFRLKPGSQRPAPASHARNVEAAPCAASSTADTTEPPLVSSEAPPAESAQENATKKRRVVGKQREEVTAKSASDGCVDEETAASAPKRGRTRKAATQRGQEVPPAQPQEATAAANACSEQKDPLGWRWNAKFFACLRFAFA